MKVFLRNTETGLFYAGPDEWTGEHSHALDFHGPDAALDTVTKSKVSTMELVVHFEESCFDLPLKIAGIGK
jgi:hypothetical protein